MSADAVKPFGTIDTREQGGFASNGTYSGFLMVGNQLRQLPIGCHLDRNRGVFSWQPGPGFAGRFRLAFIKNDAGHEMRQDVIVTIWPGWGD